MITKIFTLYRSCSKTTLSRDGCRAHRIVRQAIKACSQLQCGVPPLGLAQPKQCQVLTIGFWHQCFTTDGRKFFLCQLRTHHILNPGPFLQHQLHAQILRFVFKGGRRMFLMFGFLLLFLRVHFFVTLGVFIIAQRQMHTERFCRGKRLHQQRIQIKAIALSLNPCRTFFFVVLLCRRHLFFVLCLMTMARQPELSFHAANGDTQMTARAQLVAAP